MVDAGQRDWPKVLGTISRSGELAMSGQRPLIHDLDGLPYPAWDLFPLDEVYFHEKLGLFTKGPGGESARVHLGCSGTLYHAAGPAPIRDLGRILVKFG